MSDEVAFLYYAITCPEYSPIVPSWIEYLRWASDNPKYIFYEIGDRRVMAEIILDWMTRPV